MLLLVVRSKVLNILINLKLYEASLLVPDLLPKLFANIAKVVFQLVVLIERVDIVEFGVVTELALRMVEVLVLIQRSPLVESLLEQEHWLLFKAEVAVVHPVVLIQVIL